MITECVLLIEQCVIVIDEVVFVIAETVFVLGVGVTPFLNPGSADTVPVSCASPTGNVKKKRYRVPEELESWIREQPEAADGREYIGAPSCVAPTPSEAELRRLFPMLGH